MKFNYSSKAICSISASAVTVLFIAGLSTSAIAGNKEALKDAIVKDNQTIEIKLAETKTLDPIAKVPADAEFKKLDSNNDEKISLKEAVKDKTLASLFDEIDANHDGMITADEYAGYKAVSSTKGAEPAPGAY